MVGLFSSLAGSAGVRAVDGLVPIDMLTSPIVIGIDPIDMLRKGFVTIDMLTSPIVTSIDPIDMLRIS